MASAGCGCPLAKAIPTHDFCYYPMQAALVLAGGVFAYTDKGSSASLYGSLGTAAVLAACTGVSYSQWKKDKSAHKPATAVGLGVSAAVTVGMLTTCGAVKHNDKVALAGAVLSAGFTAFYAWTLFKDKLKKA